MSVLSVRYVIIGMCVIMFPAVYIILFQFPHKLPHYTEGHIPSITTYYNIIEPKFDINKHKKCCDIG
jgi:hypothetical protein